MHMYIVKICHEVCHIYVPSYVIHTMCRVGANTCKSRAGVDVCVYTHMYIHTCIHNYVCIYMYIYVCVYNLGSVQQLAETEKALKTEVDAKSELEERYNATITDFQDQLHRCSELESEVRLLRCVCWSIYI